MIAQLQGQVIPYGDDTVILDVGGVGYEVYVSSYTHASTAGCVSAKLFIHTHVREDVIQLFGFASRVEKELFLSLLKVNGIGPKVAMKILSGAPLHSILQMIDEGDARALSQLPKVGKKTAEQIILELKGKLVLTDTVAGSTGFGARSDIVSALVNLGFKLSDVEKTVDRMNPSTNFNDGVKLGLTSLTNC